MLFARDRHIPFLVKPDRSLYPPPVIGVPEQNITATNVKLLAGINSNYGDAATIDMSTISTSGVKSICDTFQGRRTMIGLQTWLRG